MGPAAAGTGRGGRDRRCRSHPPRDHPHAGAGALRQAGDLGEDIRQDVDRVGHDDVDRVGRVLDDLRDDGLEDGDVLVDQVQAGLTGLLVCPGGDNDKKTVSQIVIAPGRYFHGGTVRQAVTQVHGLALRLGPVYIYQHQLGKQALLQKSEGDGGTHRTAANDGRLSGICSHDCSPSSGLKALWLLVVPDFSSCYS